MSLLQVVGLSPFVLKDHLLVVATVAEDFPLYAGPLDNGGSGVPLFTGRQQEDLGEGNLFANLEGKRWDPQPHFFRDLELFSTGSYHSEHDQPSEG